MVPGHLRTSPFYSGVSNLGMSIGSEPAGQRSGILRRVAVYSCPPRMARTLSVVDPGAELSVFSEDL